MAHSTLDYGHSDLLTPILAPPEVEESRRTDYGGYKKVVGFILVWVGAVLACVSALDVPSPAPVWKTPGYDGDFGYTKSLLLIYLPLAFLAHWYWTHRDRFKLRAVMKAELQTIGVVAVVWSLLDVLFANLFFVFPAASTHFRYVVFGYSWADRCRTIGSIVDGSCWGFNIPIEELLFYLGSAALLKMLYMWANEDFLSKYAYPRSVYESEAKATKPLIAMNWRVMLIGLAVLGLAILVKKSGWGHEHTEGWPFYLFAQLIIVLTPMSAFYYRVRWFTNTRAFLLIAAVTALVSIAWEVTFALPYGWWDYQPTAMIGLVVQPWSNLTIEACALWVSVGWSVMLVYEVGKIKALSGRTWPQILWGKNSWRAVAMFSRTP